MRRAPGLQVGNGVGESQILVWNRVRVSGSVLPGFFGIFYTQMGGHCARRSLQRLWKLGLRIVAWLKPCMFCKESLGKIKFRAFPKCVGPQILSLETVYYFGTGENYWVVKKIRILISKTTMAGFCKLSLYANGLVMCMWFIFSDDWNDMSCKSLFWSPAMM